MTDASSSAQPWWCPSRAGLLAVGLFALGGAVRALRFAGPFATPYHWDETGIAVPAVYLLQGNLPVHFLNVEYMGATAAYPLAAWFAVAGTSTLALDLFAYGVGLVVFWTGYLVARRVFSRGAALFTLAVLAVPPLLFVKRSLDGLDYEFLLLLGNLVLLATHALFFRPPARLRTVFVLGLVAGLGWWNNPLILVYLAPFGLLALRSGLVRRLHIGLFAAGATLGALPAWLYELTHFPSGRFAVAGVGWSGPEPFGVRARIIVESYFPTILGVPPWLEGRAQELVLATVLLPAALAIVRAVVRDRGELRWVTGLGGGPATGPVILWGVILTNLALAFLTPRGAVGDRYLLPVYAVLPCWTGEMFHWLWGRRRVAGGIAIAGLLGVHLGVNWWDTLGTTPRAERRWSRLHASLEPLVHWLDARHIRRVYWAAESPLVGELRSYEASYLMGMRILAADLWREPELLDAHAVDAALDPPIVGVDGGDEMEALRASLNGIGMRLHETVVGQFRVLETVPRFTTGFVPLPPGHWTVIASANPELAPNLLDRDASTGWNSRDPQQPGQWIRVDLGSEQTVARLDLLALDWQEVPAGFRIDTSGDGAAWQTVVSVPRYWGPFFFSEQHAFLKVRRGRVQAIFPPVRARFLRIVQTGAVPYRSWAARELFVYGPGPPRPPAPAPGEITRALRREGVDRVLANHWLAARVQVESNGAIGAPESNFNLNSYGRTQPEPERLLRVRLNRPGAILVGSDGDVASIQALLAGEGVRVRASTVGPYSLLRWTPAAEVPRRLSRERWRATATVNGDQAGKAIDGAPGTVWGAPDPAMPGARFTLDLGSIRRVRQIQVTPGSGGSSTRDLKVEGSPDGTVWTALGPLAWAGPLYWSGSELLRDGATAWRVAFPPVGVRYLRFAPAARATRGPWVIAEIACFE